MRLIADLHIHSRFSRATSRGLDFMALHRSAVEKGVSIVGTGDFTHPGWMGEIVEQLEPAEEGLFRLKPELRMAAEQGMTVAGAGEVRFVLQVEISNIYKKQDKVRKNHNLVFVPSLDAAQRLTRALEAIGNVASDGRPILGLDARDLLEITLESDPRAFLVPAHIWTPWFSMLGSKSGFDSLEECFGDLSGEVFAVETGLSSDPPMNWRLSGLDGLRLISNSDAHSAAKIGREANILDIELGYEPLLMALKDGVGFLGTLEFYPEEGKYHLDGHRKCGVRLEPEETRALDNRCPVCGGLLTVGVLSRVLDLADRPCGGCPAQTDPFSSLVQLGEVIGQTLGVGPGSKRVGAERVRLLRTLGPELEVLLEVPTQSIARVGGSALGEAVRRVRSGELTIAPGFDGEFGMVQIFEPGERERFGPQVSFLDTGQTASRQPESRVRASMNPALEGGERGEGEPGAQLKPSRDPAVREASRGHGRALACAADPGSPSPADPLADLDLDQLRAAKELSGPLLIVAGPGSGKTRTLVSRIAYQVASGRVRPEQVLAISFTNQAAEELRERCLRSVPAAGPEAPLVTTFHAFGRRLLVEAGQGQIDVANDEERLDLVGEVIGVSGREAARVLERISLAKQSRDPERGGAADPELSKVFEGYQAGLAQRGLYDLDDLVLKAYEVLAGEPGAAARVAGRYLSVSVDEYQDVNDVQAALVSLIAPRGSTLCAIGDPDQAIYGFRGARPEHFDGFETSFPGTVKIALGTSYRLTRPVAAVACTVVGGSGPAVGARSGVPVEIVDCPTAASEAEQIVVRLERIVGGTSSFALDSGRATVAEFEDVGFGEIAILTRTRAQQREIDAALGRSGIPCRLVGEDEAHDPRSEKVAVMTMHAAKGREFEVVFISGVERGLVPLEQEGFRCDPDEERRLLYVAITRARRLVVISSAARRMLWGRRLAGGPSRFLADLPEDMITRTEPSLGKRDPTADQMKLF